jgi:hypothetical protein
MATLGYKKLRHFDDLPGWLEIATDDLEESAKQRIAIEIESHNADSIAAHLGDGQTESAAQATALSELGDPRAAAKRFKRSHLTKRDAKRIRTWLNFASPPFFSGYALFIDCAPIIAIALCYAFPFLLFSVFTGFIIVLYACLRAFPRLSYLKGKGHFHEIGFSFFAVNAMVTVILILPSINDHSLVFTAQAAYLFYTAVIPNFRVWRKLCKNPDLQPT